MVVTVIVILLMLLPRDAL